MDDDQDLYLERAHVTLWKIPQSAFDAVIGNNRAFTSGIHSRLYYRAATDVRFPPRTGPCQQLGNPTVGPGAIGTDGNAGADAASSTTMLRHLLSDCWIFKYLVDDNDFLNSWERITIKNTRNESNPTAAPKILIEEGACKDKLSDEDSLYVIENAIVEVHKGYSFIPDKGTLMKQEVNFGSLLKNSDQDTSHALGSGGRDGYPGEGSLVSTLQLPGELFGELSFVYSLPRQATCVLKGERGVFWYGI